MHGRSFETYRRNCLRERAIWRYSLALPDRYRWHCGELRRIRLYPGITPEQRAGATRLQCRRYAAEAVAWLRKQHPVGCRYPSDLRFRHAERLRLFGEESAPSTGIIGASVCQDTSRRLAGSHRGAA